MLLHKKNHNDKILNAILLYRRQTIMKVLRAIGGFFAKIGRWIRDTAWVQPLLIVGGIFAIIFSIPSITKWVQGWFKSGDAAVSFYKNNGYMSLTNGESDGKDSDAYKLLSFIFDDNAQKDYGKYGEKFFVTFVQEENSGSETIYKGWEAAKKNWGTTAGFQRVKDKQGNVISEAGEFKMYTIFIDEKNDDDENIFWKLMDDEFASEFAELSSLENPYKSNNTSVSYEGIANSGSTDISGSATFSAPTTFLFDKNFDATLDKGYSQVGFEIAEIVFDIADKGATGTNIGLARTIWDCWNHIGQFDNVDDNSYVLE